MKYIKALVAGSVLSCSFAAAAQSAPRSAYFLDGYTFRHELNPAFAGERNYVSVPALANVNPSFYSNVGVKTFLYKTDGGQYDLTTFMSPTVSGAEFMSKLSENNHINANIDITLLSAGFKAFGGFNTITIGAHTDVGVNLPKDLFAFMKLGQQGPDTRYNFSNIDVRANAMAEIALGHQRQIDKKLAVGAKLKVLLGAGGANAHIDNMDVRFGGDKWIIKADGYMNVAAGKGLYMPTRLESGAEIEKPGMKNLIDWGKIDYDSFGLSGFGMGVDLGATYRLLPDLELSAAVNDLGFMSWNHAIKARTGTGEWEFDGFQNIGVNDDQPDYEDNKIETQFDNMWYDLQDAVSFHREATESSYTKALAATIHLGAEYKMPFYKNLTGSFLFSSHIAGCASWTEGRFYANVKPVKWFDATVNYGASTYGSSFGWMLNFHPKGFNFFIGSDHMLFKVTPQFVPVCNATANINLGFNVTFGS